MDRDLSYMDCILMDNLLALLHSSMPWVKYSTPDKFPHIAHFVTAPEFKGKGYARETLDLC